MLHIAEAVHNTIESCSHLVTGITDIRIRFVAQIAETSFCCETVVKNFFTNTSNIFCYSTDFLGYPTGSIRDILVDTCFCFLNRSFYFLNISFCVIDFVPYGNCSSTKATTYQCTTNGSPSRAPTGMISISSTIVTASVRDYNAIAGTFYFYSHNCKILKINT